MHGIHPLLRTSLHGLLAWCLLAGAGFVFAGTLCTALAPIIEHAVNASQSGYLARVSVIDGASGPRLAMTCRLNQARTLSSGRTVPFLGSYPCAATEARHVLVPVLIFLVAILSWPSTGRREARRRLTGGAIAIPILVTLTAAPLLVGLADTQLHPERFTADAQMAALLRPFVFVELGGAWLLSLVAAMLCVQWAAAGVARS